MALKLSSRISKITAVDLSPEMIKIAEEKRNAELIKNIDFKVGDSCSLEFKDSSFDTIIAVNLLHLLFDPDLALQEMKRVLEDNGQIIIPTYCHGESFKSHIISRLMSLAGFRARSRWSVTSFKVFVERSGFEIIKEIVIDGPIPLVYLVVMKKDLHS